ncbi:MAG: CopG family transcriptional regulator [Rhodospirillales bacterium]|nr:CopG family transcriptional regulator [Acidobacteriota bacterium]MDE0371593.1 CopG family transcriptional regulator [Rhodospirillales bacterium]MYD94699.1 CopG family transcriptional regulator [Chloroflexota bacterium]
MSRSKTVRVPADLGDRLGREATRRGVTQTALVEAALRSFLTPEAADRRDEVLIRRLDRVTRSLGRLSRDHVIISETLALFVRYFLVVTPPIPDDEQDAARALGLERFEYFVTQLAERVAGGRTLLDDVLEEIRPAERDFFTVADFTAPAPAPAPRPVAASPGTDDA